MFHKHLLLWYADDLLILLFFFSLSSLPSMILNNIKFLFLVEKPSTIQNLFSKLFSLVVYGYLMYQTVMQFSLQVSYSPYFEIKSKIGKIKKHSALDAIARLLKEIIILKKLREGNPALWIMDNRMNFICMYIFKDFGLLWNIFFVNMRIDQKIFFTAFSKEEFSSWLEKVVPATIILGAVSLGYVILSSLFRLYEIMQSILAVQIR